MQLIPELVNLHVFKYALVLCQHSSTDYFFIFFCPHFFFIYIKDLTPALARLTLIFLLLSESSRSLSSFLHEGCPQIKWRWSCKAMLMVTGGSKRADAQQGNLRNGWTRQGGLWNLSGLWDWSRVRPFQWRGKPSLAVTDGKTIRGNYNVIEQRTEGHIIYTSIYNVYLHKIHCGRTIHINIDLLFVNIIKWLHLTSHLCVYPTVGLGCS